MLNLILIIDTFDDLTFLRHKLFAIFSLWETYLLLNVQIENQPFWDMPTLLQCPFWDILLLVWTWYFCSSTDTMTAANNLKILKNQLSKKSAKHVSYNECSFKKCCCRKSVINLDNQPLSESQMKTIGTVHQARYSRCVQIKYSAVKPGSIFGLIWVIWWHFFGIPKGQIISKPFLF